MIGLFEELMLSKLKHQKHVKVIKDKDKFFYKGRKLYFIEQKTFPAGIFSKVKTRKNSTLTFWIKSEYLTTI